MFYRAEDVLADAPETSSTPALGEPMDILTGLQLVLKKALAHDGLARGLHEAAKAIEKHAAQLCVLAEDCNQPDYTKLVQALCSEHNVNLISVPSAKKLGEWSGVSGSFLSILFLRTAVLKVLRGWYIYFHLKALLLVFHLFDVSINLF